MPKAVVIEKNSLMLWYVFDLVNNHLDYSLEVPFSKWLVSWIKNSSFYCPKQKFHPSDIVTMWTTYHKRHMKFFQNVCKLFWSVVGSPIYLETGGWSPAGIFFIKFLNQFLDVKGHYSGVGVDICHTGVYFTMIIDCHYQTNSWVNWTNTNPMGTMFWCPDFPPKVHVSYSWFVDYDYPLFHFDYFQKTHCPSLSKNSVSVWVLGNSKFGYLSVCEVEVLS